MNRGFGFLLAIPVFFIAVCLLMQYQYYREEQELFEQYVLVQQVDYATDAAAAEILEQAHIGTDYQDWGRINTDPETALNVFQTVMLLDYDFPLTQKSYDMLSTAYMPIFCVAAYDGYYVYQLNKDLTNGWRLQGSHKIPYSYHSGGDYYALNLGMDNCRKLEAGKFSIKELSVILSKQQALYHINSAVSDDLTYRYQEYEHQRRVQQNGKMADYRDIYFPAGLTTMTEINAIEGPTVIAMIDDWDLNTTHAIDAFSIGGAKLEPARMVAGYVRGATRYYAYSDLLPEYTGAAGYELNILKLFTSVDEAAKEGYHYDPKYMDG